MPSPDATATPVEQYDVPPGTRWAALLAAVAFSVIGGALAVAAWFTSDHAGTALFAVLFLLFGAASWRATASLPQLLRSDGQDLLWYRRGTWRSVRVDEIRYIERYSSRYARIVMADHTRLTIRIAEGWVEFSSLLVAVTEAFQPSGGAYGAFDRRAGTRFSKRA